MPAVAGAETSAEDAFLARLSIEVIPRLQREYLRATLKSQEGSVIDLGRARRSEFLKEVMGLLSETGGTCEPMNSCFNA
ncbi:hypothetical protein HFN88_18400 [Rhizobium laguerreae]|uniref:hypothetical protein n=1 Tax=Rhizobium laguerreae TaxID=1076926 RepID=UPI001C919D85|nr:hypothetical protein [Rhizobium laguerreae]MBY3394646.1 hypothetical protein [Rhizobium laguerreae]